MPVRAAQPLLESIFGSDKDKLARSIKERRMNRAAGLPEDYAEKMIEGMPVMGMTKYLKAGSKIPDVAGRVRATNIYKRAMSSMGMENIGDEFAKRYPRIAAHINPYISEGEHEGLAHLGTAFNEPHTTAAVGLNPSVSRNLRNTMSHEGTHVAQRLGMGKKMPNAYQAAEDLVGYEMNPFEQSARAAARRYGLPEGRALAPFKTRQALEAITEMAEPGSEQRRLLAAALQRK